MFENVKVGDSLYDICFGWGRVKAINRLDYSDKAHFIEVDFTNMKKFTYSKKGKNLDLGCTNQTLFWDEVKFEVPEIPFSLEDELRKLEVGETFNVKNKKIIVSLAETDMSCKGCIFNKVGIDCITLQSKGIIPECDVFLETTIRVLFLQR